MLDTNRIRFHGINAIKQDALSIAKMQNKDDFIHVVPSHQQLYKAILNAEGKNISMKVFYNSEKDQVTDQTEDSFLFHETQKKMNAFFSARKTMFLKDVKGEKRVTLGVNGDFSAPSSQSHIYFNVNENAGYIDFEFSIPKYLYAHSLAQFIPQAGSEFYFRNSSKCNSMKFQASILFERYQKFLDRFFLDLQHTFGLEEEFDKNYIEIRRLDLCYNQFFDSKEKAFTVLEQQKKLHYKNERKNSDASRNYYSSINYNSSTGARFKIYHKGTEYFESDGDFKKHKKINQKYLDMLFSNDLSEFTINHKDLIMQYFDKPDSFVFPPNIERKLKEKIRIIRSALPFDVIFLKNEMDKVLRYEMSFNHEALAMIYNKKVFRKNDSLHKDRLRKYKKLKVYFDTRTNLDIKPNRTDVREYKNFHKFLHKRTLLLLSENSLFKEHCITSTKDYDLLKDQYKITSFPYRYTMLGNKPKGIFDRNLIIELYNEFRKHFNHYQFRELNTYDSISDQIREYNDKVEKNIELYNSVHHSKVVANNENARHFSTKYKIVKKATQLLTQKELREKDLKKINATILLSIVDQIQKKEISLDEHFKRLGVKGSSKHRYKKDLEKFGIYTNSLTNTESVEMPDNFNHYYWNTDAIVYRDRFYTKLNTHITYKNPFNYE